MPQDYDYHFSRSNRLQKRKKNKKWLYILSVIGISLVVLFFVIRLFSSNSIDSRTAQSTDGHSETTTEEQESMNKEDDSINEQEAESDGNADQSFENEAQSHEANSIELEEIESDDALVMDAYTANWEPVPTEQSEPHTISWEQDSVDWEEMLEAAERATGIASDDMYYLWVSGNGEQQVIATFSDETDSQHYRVYLSWIENEGWQPTRVDRLTENDQKYRFETNQEEESSAMSNDASEEEARTNE